MDDEPLSEWARRRDARVGRLRATPLVPGDGPQGAHLHPGAPRLIQRWNGHSWEPHAFAADLAEARKLLHPPEARPPAPAQPQPQAPPPPMRDGRGRHRKPRPDGA
ncbi:DUF6087 family protein [Streptomyces sp. NPDC093252]|uniref:DUF6087 family protein n=1 Tax=Streptomyces sp. NPDC093252 TaxID=3154980 RepID=UPI00342F2713